MKKIKFKRRKTKIFMTKYFMILVLLVFVISMGSAYAVFSQQISISGTVTGNMTFTYYFEKPSSWTGSTTYAYLWIDSTGAKIDAWPGVAMEYVENSSSGKPVYKLEISSTKNSSYYNFNFDHIIFNDNTNQTFDMTINRSSNNNQLATIEPTYSSSTEKRIFAKLPKTWSPVSAYIWNNSSGNNTGAWPGTDISANKISEEGYVITVSNAYDRIIFNRARDTSLTSSDVKQTIDLTIPSSQDMTFVAGSTPNSENKLKGSWSNTFALGRWSGNYVNPSTLSPSHTH